MGTTKFSRTARVLLAIALTLSATAWSFGKNPKKAAKTNPSVNLKVNPDSRIVGAVYALTNGIDGNAVAVFHRMADGILIPAGLVPTGGLGIGDGPDGEGLQSQGALVLSKDDRFLYAVNGGSDDLSVFVVEPKGLVHVQQIASGGHRPISLTVHGNLLYVLNYDRLLTSSDSGNITGFRIHRNGRLSPLAGSSRPLSGIGTNPGQVAFSPDGHLLAVTEKATNLIVTYTVGASGKAGGPLSNPSSGVFPFSLAFGKNGVLVVAEDFGDVPGQGAASSYVTTANGVLRLVSGTVRDFQDGTCWVVTSNDGRFAYVVNTNNSVITAYGIGADGSLSRLNSNGITALSGGVKPRDLALSHDGRYLYVLNSVSGTVGALMTQSDGSLVPLGVAGMLPAPGSNGLAAR